MAGSILPLSTLYIWNPVIPGRTSREHNRIIATINTVPVTLHILPPVLFLLCLFAFLMITSHHRTACGSALRSVPGDASSLQPAVSS